MPGRFESVLGSENNLGKSKVAVAVDWLKTHGADPKRTLFVGDTTHDFETAAAIGCDCALVARGHNSRARLEATGCPVFGDLRGVLRLVRGGKTVLLAPDSFKGTLSAVAVASTLADVLRGRVFENFRRRKAHTDGAKSARPSCRCGLCNFAGRYGCD